MARIAKSLLRFSGSVVFFIFFLSIVRTGWGANAPEMGKFAKESQGPSASAAENMSRSTSRKTVSLSAAQDAPFDTPMPAYPYADRWLATVSMALVKDPDNQNTIDKSLIVKKRGQSSAALRAPAQSAQPQPAVSYRVYQHADLPNADLVLIIPGLGSTGVDHLPAFLGDAIYNAGHNVLVVPNDFTAQFALGASRTGIVGVPLEDALDMMNLITQILAKEQAEDHLSSANLKVVGYSLGALQSAFVSAQNAVTPVLSITKTVLINTPVDLNYGIQVLDTIGGLQQTLSEESKIYLDGLELRIGWKMLTEGPRQPDYYFDLANYLPVGDQDLEYLVGKNFSGSVQTMISTAEKILGGPGGPVSSGAKNFGDYMQKIVLPNVAAKSGYPTTTDGLNQISSLNYVENFLRSGSNVYLLHNEDDFLLNTGDEAYLKSVFGSRVIFYDHGGHMGNIWYDEHQSDLLSALQ